MSQTAQGKGYPPEKRQSTKLGDIVKLVFSKNAGPYLVSFDLQFESDEAFERAMSSPALGKEALAARLKVAPKRIYSVRVYAPARVIKINLIREISSGDFGDSSVFGSQFWPALLDIDLEWNSLLCTSRGDTHE